MWSKDSARRRTSSLGPSAPTRWSSSPASTSAAIRAIRRSGAAVRAATRYPASSAAARVSAPARRKIRETSAWARSTDSSGSPARITASGPPLGPDIRVVSTLTFPASTNSMSEYPLGAVSSAAACLRSSSAAPAGSPASDPPRSSSGWLVTDPAPGTVITSRLVVAPNVWALTKERAAAPTAAGRGGTAASLVSTAAVWASRSRSIRERNSEPVAR